MRFRLILGVAVICVAGAVLPMWAHHSHGNYEDTFMDISGVVKEVHLVVPHSWIYWKSRMPRASRKCGLWKQPAAPGFKELESRWITSSRATP